VNPAILSNMAALKGWFPAEKSRRRGKYSLFFICVPISMWYYAIAWGARAPLLFDILMGKVEG